MGADAGEQFLDAEGLGHVIVCAGVERLDLGPLVFANREDDDGGGGTGADGAADLDTAHPGHHQVGDYEVRLPVAKQEQGFLGVVGRAHVKSLRGERRAQHARNLRLVVNDQNSSRHVWSMSLRKITS